METKMSSTCIQTSECTAVEVVLTVYPDTPVEVTFKATGYAKKHPKDIHHSEIGMKLAYGRALEQLGKRLQMQANLMISFPAIQSYRVFDSNLSSSNSGAS